MSQKGYLIAEAKVHDAAAYEVYKPLSLAAVEHYGGRFVVRGGASEVLEGQWSPPQRMVIVEFDSIDQAKRFYHSPEYRLARKARENAGEMNMLVIAGIENLI